ncbi:hypothetical protein FRB95_000381 [Tulasnella sp. JGI-2019a]|nr:hypothetical protein FRB95_000381 [Tulasnella sp. JGI-2019a]
MFYHYIPTSRPYSYYQRPFYEAPLSNPSPFCYDDSPAIDPVVYRRLALEHQRKAEEALLRAEEHELQQERRRRAVALDRLRQAALLNSYDGNYYQQSPYSYSPRAVNRAHSLQAACQPPRRTLPRREPVMFRERTAPTQREQTPVSEQKQQEFIKHVFDALHSDTSSQHVAEPRPLSGTPTPVRRSPSVPTATAPKDLHTFTSPPSPTPSHSSLNSISFSSIDAIQAEFDAFKANFTVPNADQLDFMTGDAPKLAYTSKNLPFLQHESDLTKLLTKLDAVESNGAESVRGARKALVQAIELELCELDRVKMEAWASRNDSGEAKNAEDERKEVTESVPSETFKATDQVNEQAPSTADENATPNVDQNEHGNLEVIPIEVTSENDLSTEEPSSILFPEPEVTNQTATSISLSTMIAPLDSEYDTPSEVKVEPEQNLGTIIQEDDWTMNAEQSSLPSSPASQSAPALGEQDGEYFVGSPDLESSDLQLPSTSELVGGDTLGSEDEGTGSESDGQIRHEVEIEDILDEDSHSDFEML